MSANKKQVESMIRVNYAGEYAAKMIYTAQEKFTKDPHTKAKIIEMKEQELEHLDYFEQELKNRNIRPSLLMPAWHVVSYALGSVSAILGKKSAMACTIAVEEVITEHYQQQLNSLGEDEAELKKKIQKFKDDEDEHRETAIEHDGKSAPFYRIFSNIVKFGSKSAIEIAKKI